MLAQIVLFDGFDPLDAIAPYEVLTAGGAITNRMLEVELVSAEGPRQVPSGIDPLSLEATARLDPHRADLIVVPGVLAINARVVDDGDLVTASSVTSGLDLGLYLLERELGPRVAHAAESMFAHERRGTVWRNAGAEPTVTG